MVQKKKSKKELIAENDWLMSLPGPLRWFMGILKYQLKELLILLIVILIGAWFLTSFGYEGKKVHIKPGVKVRVKVQQGASTGGAIEFNKGVKAE